MKFKYLITFLVFPMFLFSMEPGWVKFSQAVNLYKSGEFKEALDYFIDVTSSDTPYPEAEYMIGLIYLEEGELLLAENQIRKAIELSSYLEVPQDLTEYKYKLCDIYILQEDYNSYEKLLKEIAGGEEINLDEVRDQKAYYDTLISSGLNRVLHLYRRRAENSLNAKIRLGYFYNSKGEYEKALSYLLSPVISLITEVVEDNKQYDLEYIFPSIEEFFTQVKNSKRASTYFYENDFYKLFYSLGYSLLGLGQEEKAMEVFKLLGESGFDSKWVRISKKQISNPTLENWSFIY